MSTAPPEKARSTKELVSAVRTLLGSALDDAALRAALEELARERAFGGLTGLWGPVLYQRNRVLFRPFILAHFATWSIDSRRMWHQVSWTINGAALDAWLEEVDRRDDVELFRKLYAWKHSTGAWTRLDEAAWRTDLLDRIRAAANRHQRNTILSKFDLPNAMLDEPTATALDAIDPVAAKAFILRHLERSWFWDDAKRQLWEKLFTQAHDRGDDDFAFALYRKQVAVKVWKAEVIRLCGEVNDPEMLIQALERRHPEGYGLDLGDALYEAVKRRGRDVLPYVMRHLRNVWGGYRLWSSFDPLLKLAEHNEWLDLWSGLIRVTSSNDRFDREVARLTANATFGDDEVRRRLGALAGVSREWNFPGLGMAQVHALKDSTALALYQRFPELIRGPFKMHAAPLAWGESYTSLAEVALAAGDDAVIDFLASRAVTRSRVFWGGTKALIALAERLSDYYEGLRATDPAEFSRRAASVLGQVPPYSIANYNHLVQTNRLARLLYERSSAAYLDDPRSLRDLLEAPEIYAQALAFRALGLDDDRARALAAENLDLLQATLLRPLHRRTRLLALRALANAASTLADARCVLERARQVLDLPDKGYPKEALVGLIGQLLHRHPELRSARERPVIYGEVSA